MLPITVTIYADTAQESDERSNVELSNADPVTIAGSTAIVTIINDDSYVYLLLTMR